MNGSLVKVAAHAGTDDHAHSTMLPHTLAGSFTTTRTRVLTTHVGMRLCSSALHRRTPTMVSAAIQTRHAVNAIQFERTNGQHMVPARSNEWPCLGRASSRGRQDGRWWPVGLRDGLSRRRLGLGNAGARDSRRRRRRTRAGVQLTRTTNTDGSWNTQLSADSNRPDPPPPPPTFQNYCITAGA